MAAMIENLTAKIASLEQQLAAQSTAFEKRLAQLEFHHKFAETNQMMGNMDFQVTRERDELGQCLGCPYGRRSAEARLDKEWKWKRPRMMKQGLEIEAL
ncbi:uncharacterized protein FTOL_10994 [Fusarium torulosum]|uniref:Uncharacterized protein n=1 Tax=Fusarium torulosum TaxID=33205 RepID=A0AAE8SMV3_9HYPO|nr:uncharacterized protein FTOL_10994 [Fusarium torulosum]